MTVKTLQIYLCLAILLTGCTWVDLNEQGYAVAIISQEQGNRCETLGTTTSTVLDNVGLLPRNADKVREELSRLARNDAGEMGGDAISPTGEPIDGSQSFTVYRCNG